jgi:hypothetical protein
MKINYLSDDTVTAEEYDHLMGLYVKQMEKTNSLQEEVTALMNLLHNEPLPKTLLKLCQMWHITRQSTQGMMVEDHHSQALKAFDKLIQDVVERNRL